MKRIAIYGNSAGKRVPKFITEEIIDDTIESRMHLAKAIDELEQNRQINGKTLYDMSMEKESFQDEVMTLRHSESEEIRYIKVLGKKNKFDMLFFLSDLGCIGAICIFNICERDLDRIKITKADGEDNAEVIEYS